MASLESDALGWFWFLAVPFVQTSNELNKNHISKAVVDETGLIRFTNEKNNPSTDK